MALVKQAEIYSPRTGVGTVPGTVPVAISRGTFVGVGGWVLWVVLRVTCTATVGSCWKATRGWTLAPTDNATSRPTRMATRRLIYSASRRGTCRRICVATSTANPTASCGSRLKSGPEVGIEPQGTQRRQRARNGLRFLLASESSAASVVLLRSVHRWRSAEL